MKKLIDGISHVFQAFSFVLKNGLWWTFLVPILFSAIMVYSLFSIGDDFIEMFLSYLVDVLSLETPEQHPEPFWDKILYWLKITAEYAIYGVLWLVCTLIYWKIQKYIILIFMAPLIAWVSEKAEEKILGNSYEFKFQLFLKDTWRGILIALRNLFLELALIIVVGIVISLLTSVFAPLGFIAAPLSLILTFVVSAYYYGYSSFDYLNERNRLTISGGNRLIWDNKALVVGNGLVFGCLMLIPFIGVVLAPVLCPVGAVLSSEKYKLHKKTA